MTEANRMRPEIKGIEANDISSWPDWAPPDPEDILVWFTVSIGLPGSCRADLFQVAVTTPRGVKGRRRKGRFVGLVVERFEPAAVEQAIRDFVAGAEGPTWEAVVDRLLVRMSWEYNRPAGR